MTPGARSADCAAPVLLARAGGRGRGLELLGTDDPLDADRVEVGHPVEGELTDVLRVALIIVDRMAGGSVNDEGDPENVRELSFDGMAYLHAVSVEGVVSPEELEASAAATRSGE